MIDIDRYDIITIGAGHAGCEAALAAARMGCKVLLLAINIDRIAHMPCNPSIGGIGKGQLVREVDALGGEMGLNIDATLVQIKTLNSSKGPAVRALRAQADKRQYSWLMKTKILDEPNISLRQGEVVSVGRRGREELQVITADGASFISQCVVVATGTFLRGEMVIGAIKCSGGRAGELPSNYISNALRRLGLELARFQSATPPRVWAGSVDIAKMILQPGERGSLAFSFRGPKKSRRRQRDCYLTYTNKKTHKVISGNLHLSPIKSGSVSAKGPRYCPSIDRKVINFPDRDRHPVFVEPEGRQNHELYLQGLTTSMPVVVQEKIIQTVPGLEEARIIRPGYAVAYDYLLPYQLKNTLECAAVPGLFTAGQINGTSGYEEAAAQGLIAGINAALKCLGKEPLVIDRAQAYIGVLIDDLVTKEIDEPYRMFTSRAEHRLVLRSDNADLRLTSIGHSLGLISEARMEQVRKKQRDIEKCLAKLKATNVKLADLPEFASTAPPPRSPAENPSGRSKLENAAQSPRCNSGSPQSGLGFVGQKADEHRGEGAYVRLRDRAEVEDNAADGALGRASSGGHKAKDLLKRPEITIDRLAKIVKLGKIAKDSRYQAEIEIKYEGYIKRQLEQIAAQKRLEEVALPFIDYATLEALSTEARQKLGKIQPQSLGQAARIAGVSPADISILMVHLQQWR